MMGHIVRTDELPDDRLAVERLLLDRSIILCTVETLSNPALLQRNVFEIVPVERLVVDEASQIYAAAFVVSTAKYLYTHLSS